MQPEKKASARWPLDCPLPGMTKQNCACAMSRSSSGCGCTLAAFCLKFLSVQATYVYCHDQNVCWKAYVAQRAAYHAIRLCAVGLYCASTCTL